jgi:hypothetical protein
MRLRIVAHREVVVTKTRRWTWCNSDADGRGDGWAQVVEISAEISDSTSCNFATQKHVLHSPFQFPLLRGLLTASRSRMHLHTILAFLLGSLSICQALKFELAAHQAHQVTPRCIRNFVSADTLVVVTAIVSGHKGDGQGVNIHVFD